MCGGSAKRNGCALPEKDMVCVFSYPKPNHTQTVNHLAGSHTETVIPLFGLVLGFLVLWKFLGLCLM
jgi:hypothetical protein